MPLLPLLLRYWRHIAIVLAVAGVALFAYRWAFERGQAEREAHYAPILAGIERERIAAEARVQALESAAQRITADIEASHAEALRAVETRAATAEQRIAVLLRNRPRGDRCPVSALPGTPASSADTAAESERDDRLAQELAAVGRRCESDSRQLASLIEWVRRQAALE